MSTRLVRILGSLVIVFAATFLYLSSIANGPDVELRFNRDVPSSETLGMLSPALEDIRTWPQWFYSLAGARFVDTDTIDPKAALTAPTSEEGAELPLADAAGVGGAAHDAEISGASAIAGALGKATGVGATARSVPVATPPAVNKPRSTPIPPEALVAAGRRVLLFIDPQKGPWSKFEILARITQVVPGRMIVFELEDDSTHKLTHQFDHLEWKVELRPSASDRRPTMIHGEVDAHTSHWRSRLFGQIAHGVLMNQVYFMNLFKLASFGSEEAEQPDYLRRH